MKKYLLFLMSSIVVTGFTPERKKLSAKGAQNNNNPSIAIAGPDRLLLYQSTTSHWMASPLMIRVDDQSFVPGKKFRADVLY